MNSIIVSTIILIINISQVIYANPHHRREPVGFQGTRGRRSIDFDKNFSDTLDDNYAINNQKNDNEPLFHTKDRLETPPIIASATTESIINNNNLVERMTSSDSPMEQLTLVKRAPAMGFQGMRGKKDNEYFTDLDKRLSMGFQGVRGKKYFINYPHFSYAGPKRAPSGFMGMRGKKSYYDDEFSTEQQYKRAPSGFMGMRGKRLPDDNSDTDEQSYNSNEFDLKLYQALLNSNDLLNHLYPDQLNSIDENANENMYEKRAPAGFVGMRGRRFFDDELNNIDDLLEYEKRAPSGFTAMRGKRAPVGFMGMRGKKDDSNVIEHFDEKRAPAGFVGMRGKKGPLGASGFFGTRGKKFPYQFRTKFVGVRGKKDLMPSNSLDDNNMEKRQPSGFVGMRGKKDSSDQ